MRFLHRHLHRIFLVLTVLALGGCELLGFFPDDEPSALETVDVVNQADESVYVMAMTQDVMSRIYLAPEIEPEADHPNILAHGEVLEADFEDGLHKGEVAVFVLYVESGDDSYRLSAIVDRTYEQLERQSFRYTIKPGDLGQIELEVHLNNSFNDDRVRVKIDGHEVFDGRVTTNYVLSLAEVIQLTKSSGSHEIEVQVNDGDPSSTTFDLDHPLYILVRYYPEDLPTYNIQEGIYFDITEERPMYD